MNNPSIFDPLFIFCVKKRARIINFFKIIYLSLVALLFTGGWSIYRVDVHFGFFYNLAIKLGQIAILVYVLTTIPGITRRFGLQHRLIQILMIFRRHLGITMFLLVTIHFMWVKGIDIFFKQLIIIPPPLFQLMGTGAFMLLFFMFLTSNDFSVKRLGKWWNRIHSATYIIVWLIFLHVALQRLSIWSVLIGIDGIVQVSSWGFYWWKRKSIVTV